MHKYDQQDCAYDRDDKLAHQSKAGEIKQGEIADDKIGNNCSDYANHQVAQNAETSAPHGAARQASGDGAANDLQRQIAKSYRKCCEYQVNTLLVLAGAAHCSARVHLNPNSAAARLRVASDEQCIVATIY
jgi:hypothetical protein